MLHGEEDHFLQSKQEPEASLELLQAPSLVFYMTISPPGFSQMNILIAAGCIFSGVATHTFVRSLADCSAPHLASSSLGMHVYASCQQSCSQSTCAYMM